MGAASIKEWSLAKFVEGYRLRARATGKLNVTSVAVPDVDETAQK